MQTAYQIRLSLTEESLKDSQHLLFDSKKINSDQSSQIVYNGPQLHSGEHIFWQVRVWDNKGDVSDWSKAASFEMGLLQPADWKASWIEPAIVEDTMKSNPCPLLRKEFKLKGKIKEARIYVSSHGLYQLDLNGKKVGDELFTPGWTSYNKRIQYQVYDVTSELQPGENTIGVTLGDGWYRGFLAWSKNIYGNRLAFILQLKVVYENGKEETIVTDQSWKSATGPILMSDIYNGETYDARLEMNGWDSPGYDDKNWKPVILRNFSKNILIASESVPVRICDIIKPVKKIITPKGELVFDMGQNMVGWVRFSLKGKAGEKITLQHAEVLDKDGNFYTANLRAAKATDQYIFKGNGIETFEPHFTFHGFRYVKLYRGDKSG